MDFAHVGDVLALPLLDLAGRRSLPLILLAFARSIAEVLFSPAEQALLVRVVPEDRLPIINTFIATSQRLPGTAGPSLDGLLMAVTGTTVAFSIDAVSSLASAFLIVHIVHVFRHISTGQQPPSSSRGFASGVLDQGRVIWMMGPLRILPLATVVTIVGFAAFRLVDEGRGRHCDHAPRKAPIGGCLEHDQSFMTRSVRAIRPTPRPCASCGPARAGCRSRSEIRPTPPRPDRSVPARDQPFSVTAPPRRAASARVG